MELAGNVGLEFDLTDLAWVTSDTVAVSDLAGRLSFVKVTENQCACLDAVVSLHKSSIRTLGNYDSKTLVSSSKRGVVCLFDLETQTVKKRLQLSTASAPFVVHALSTNLLAIGSEDGDVTLVDPRSNRVILHNAGLCSDYISGIEDFPDQKADELLISSGDGSFLLFDLRRGEPVASCDSLDDEITCMSPLCTDRTFMATCSEQGSINVFKYDYWGQPCDRFLLGGDKSIVSCANSPTNGLYYGTFDGTLGLLANHKIQNIYTYQDQINKLKHSPDKHLALLIENFVHFIDTSHNSQKAHERFLQEID
jgi:WD40 repeat protein